MACSECQKRLDAANELVRFIASCGRRFFEYKGTVAHMEMDDRGRVWWFDEYTKKRVYMHQRWLGRSFSHGGTLNGFVRALRDFVKTGEQLNSYHRDHWGYGDDMPKVIARAVELGIIGGSE